MQHARFGRDARRHKTVQQPSSQKRHDQAQAEGQVPDRRTIDALSMTELEGRNGLGRFEKVPPILHPTVQKYHRPQ